MPARTLLPLWILTSALAGCALPPTADATVESGPRLDVAVRVVGPDGAGLSGAFVTLGTIPSDPIVRVRPLDVAVSDAEGWVRLAGDPADGERYGHFVLVAEHPDMLVAIDPAPVVPLRRGQRRRIRLAEPDAVREVRLVDARGRPAAGVTAWVTQARLALPSWSRGGPLVERPWVADGGGRLRVPVRRTGIPTSILVDDPEFGHCDRRLPVAVGRPLELAAPMEAPHTIVALDSVSGAPIPDIPWVDRRGRRIGITDRSGVVENVPARCRPDGLLEAYPRSPLYTRASVEVRESASRVMLAHSTVQPERVRWEDGEPDRGLAKLTYPGPEITPGARLPDGDRWVRVVATHGEEAIERARRSSRRGSSETDARAGTVLPEQEVVRPIGRDGQPWSAVRIRSADGFDVPFRNVRRVRIGTLVFHGWTDGASILRVPLDEPIVERWTISEEDEPTEEVEVSLGVEIEGPGPSVPPDTPRAEPIDPPRRTHAPGASTPISARAVTTAHIVPRGRSDLDLSTLRTEIRVVDTECTTGLLPRLREAARPLVSRAPTRRAGGIATFEDVPHGSAFWIDFESTGPESGASFHPSIFVEPLGVGESRTVPARRSCSAGGFVVRVTDWSGNPRSRFPLEVTPLGSGGKGRSRRVVTDGSGRCTIDHLRPRGAVEIRPGEVFPGAASGVVLVRRDERDGLARAITEIGESSPRFARGGFGEVRDAEGAPRAVRAVSPGNRSTELELVVLDCAPWAAQVRATDGSPLAGAEVTVHEVGFGERSTVADAEGRFTFPCVCTDLPLAVVLRSDAAPHLAHEQWFADRDAVPAEGLVFDPEDAKSSRPTLRGEITLVRGPVIRVRPDPLPEERGPVRFEEGTGRSRTGASITWEGDEIVVRFPLGTRAALGSNPPSEVGFCLVSDTWVSEWAVARLEHDETAIVSVPVERRIAQNYPFRVHDAEGNPVPGTRVRVVPRFARWLGHPEIPEGITDARGEVRVSCDTPVREIHGMPPEGWTPFEVPWAETVGGDPAVAGTVPLLAERRVTLEIELSDEALREDPDLEFLLYSETPSGPRPSVLGTPQPIFQRRSADSDGRVRFPVVDAGEYSLVVRKGRHWLRRERLGHLSGPVRRVLGMVEPCVRSGRVRVGDRTVRGGRLRIGWNAPTPLAGEPRYIGVSDTGEYEFSTAVFGPVTIVYEDPRTSAPRRPGLAGGRRTVSWDLAPGAAVQDLEFPTPGHR